MFYISESIKCIFLFFTKALRKWLSACKPFITFFSSLLWHCYSYFSNGRAGYLFNRTNNDYDYKELAWYWREEIKSINVNFMKFLPLWISSEKLWCPQILSNDQISDIIFLVFFSLFFSFHLFFPLLFFPSTSSFLLLFYFSSTSPFLTFFFLLHLLFSSSSSTTYPL